MTFAFYVSQMDDNSNTNSKKNSTITANNGYVVDDANATAGSYNPSDFVNSNSSNGHGTSLLPNSYRLFLIQRVLFYSWSIQYNIGW